MKRIGVVTSGGDAPGMNTAIRAVVRTALGARLEVFGIRRGFRGLIEDDIFQMDSRMVGGIINTGGTILRSIRCPEFKEETAREKAYQNLKSRGIEGLVVIGGDGSAWGAYKLFSGHNLPIVLIPASIDNDLFGTDYTIGFDTAVNTAVDAIDRIRDTATSHERTFIIEVMGREKGNLALEVAVACGAEIVLIPEIEIDWEKVASDLTEHRRKGKLSSVIILAEGAGKAQDAAKILKEKFPDREIRFSVLGYIQRGGKPTAFTRILATRFGVEAVRMLQNKLYGYMVGLKDGKITPTPLKQVVSEKKPPPLEYLEIIKKMAI